MKNILIAVFFSFFFLSLSAQTQESAGIHGYKKNRFAFLLSPQISWMRPDHIDVDANGSVFGFNLGLAYNRFFEKNYAFSTGLFFNAAGGKLTYSDSTYANVGGEIIEVTDLDYKLKYVDIPLGLKLMTNDFRRTRFFMDVGLDMMFNFKARNDDGKSLSEEVKLFNSGFYVGGGVEYSVGGSTYLIFGLRYDGGFTDVTDNYTIEDKTNMNRLEFRFGVVF